MSMPEPLRKIHRAKHTSKIPPAPASARQKAKVQEKITGVGGRIFGQVFDEGGGTRLAQGKRQK